mmetsp:Transcript_85817/g.199488  ORF Transcript_85817/g.199488 Transcript_85817/m.199488 type:complete len:315 (+) Transcript_85817:284-1228(+)
MKQTTQRVMNCWIIKNQSLEGMPVAKMMPDLMAIMTFWTFTSSVIRCTYAKGNCVSKYVLMVAMPSRAPMHCVMIIAVRGAGDLWWSMAATQIRMIQTQSIMGLCQRISVFFSAPTSTSVSKSLTVSASNSSRFRAACTNNSIDAKPYLATWLRTDCHFLSLSSHEMIMLTFAKASKTLPSAEMRSAHHLVRVKDTYNAKQKGTKALIWFARFSKGSTLRSAKSAKSPKEERQARAQLTVPMRIMISTFHVAAVSIVKTVPLERQVSKALYFTRAAMSYRRIFGELLRPKVRVVTLPLISFAALMWSLTLKGLP